jgi:hypothetical protein
LSDSTGLLFKQAIPKGPPISPFAAVETQQQFLAAQLFNNGGSMLKKIFWSGLLRSFLASFLLPLPPRSAS